MEQSSANKTLKVSLKDLSDTINDLKKADVDAVVVKIEYHPDGQPYLILHCPINPKEWYEIGEY